MKLFKRPQTEGSVDCIKSPLILGGWTQTINWNYSRRRDGFTKTLSLDNTRLLEIFQCDWFWCVGFGRSFSFRQRYDKSFRSEPTENRSGLKNEDTSFKDDLTTRVNLNQIVRTVCGISRSLIYVIRTPFVCPLFGRSTCHAKFLLSLRILTTARTRF